jgi:hypothetical protein
MAIAPAGSLVSLGWIWHGTEWRELETRLEEYVTNYSWRIIPLRDGFQL